MKHGKIITVFGSLEFQRQMILQSELLKQAGYDVSEVIYPGKITDNATEDVKRQILHRHPIDKSDGIFVVNVNGYIDEFT